MGDVLSLRPAAVPLPVAARVAGISQRRVRALVREGVVAPERGPRGQLLLPAEQLAKLRASVPVQGVLPFHRADVVPLQPRRDEPPRAEQLYDQAWVLEEERPDLAKSLYLKVIAIEPAHADAHVNLGRLLHEEGAHADAEATYRQALKLRPRDPTALFNLAVVLEDQGRAAEAVEAYRAALAADEHNADAHFNLARLLEAGGDGRGALRHLHAYRKLTRGA